MLSARLGVGTSVSDYQKALDFVLCVVRRRMEFSFGRAVLLDNRRMENRILGEAVRLDRYELHHGLHGK